MKFKTVREGELAVIYNHYGEGRLVVGPERVFLFRERLRKLEQKTANQFEYLVIKNNDGFVNHKAGPCNMYDNPLVYQSIEVKPATMVDANHVLVVYKKLKDNSVERRIVDGPTVFMPEAEEWCHNFVWHGEDPQQKGRMIPAHNKFDQLAIVPDQFYYNVKDVRTNDDTLLTVKLMIFFELNSVIKMLENTHDPVADMINGVCADVISFSGKLTYQGFLNQTKKLSDLSTFPQLLQRSERVGYQVNKVVYRGYHASDQLQAMQDSAIASRTKMRLNADLEAQNQRLKDFKLQKEQERSTLKQDMERNRLAHNQKIENIKQDHQLQLKKNQHEYDLQSETITNQTHLEIQRAENESEMGHLEQLSELNVDLTQHLVNQQVPAAAEVLQVVKCTGTGV